MLADFQVQRRVNEFEQLRFDSSRREELQHSLACANVPAGISADINNETFLRESLFRNDALDFFHEGSVILNPEIKQS